MRSFLNRAKFPNAHITGPSYGHLPEFADDKLSWFTEWAAFIAQNNSVPDAVSMHFLYDDGDLATSISTMQGFLKDAGIEYTAPFMINEYGSINQEQPSGSSWQISQHERNEAWGLKSNWRGEGEIHDYLANIIGKASVYPNYNASDADYWPTKLWPVYRYYGSVMKGYRVRTEETPDKRGDAYTVVNSDDRKVRILTGTRGSTGPWAISVNGLETLGLDSSGSVDVHTLYFRPGDLYEEVDGTVDQGISSYSYTDGSLVITIPQSDADGASAFEFSY